MKKIFLFTLLIAINSCCFIGAGKNSKIIDNGNNKFPSLSGIDLEGVERNLPDALDGKYNFIALGFEREHQKAIDQWIKLIDKITIKNNEIKFFELPIIYELGGFSRAWINNGMRFGIHDEIARKRTITVYTKREEFLKIMKMIDNKIYALIVDKNGNIIWRAEGLPSKTNIESLEKFLKIKI